ncbi:hypothetical protein TrST_g3844 [Triparma strigata]|uniref:Uncharacterized protein n=1 Tax=Triparma strigata TaxID=1606541 RepID=A0A9W7EWP9_9STRA|nr:hypothetical protein TrST_g3844 [Triparma strigata]
MVLVISSDETGLLKTFQCSVTISSNTVMHRPATTSHLPPDLTQGRGNGITSLNWIGSDKASIAVGRKGPSVELWKAEEDTIKFCKRIDLFSSGPDAEAADMYEDVVNVNGWGGGEYLTAVTSYGNVFKVDVEADVESKEGGGGYERMTQKPLVPRPPEATRSKSFRGRNPVESSCYLSDTLLALGGRDREVQIFDLNNMKAMWKAKNIPPDPQTLLQHPLWQTCISSNSETEFCAGTAYKELRLYDTRQRRPRAVVGGNNGEVIESMITACEWGGDEGGGRIIVGTSEGYVHDVDVRMLKVKRRLVGPNGCVKDIKAKGEWVGSVGLDRIWNCWDDKGRRRGEVYIRQRGGAFLWGAGEIQVVEEGSGEGEEVGGGEGGRLVEGDVEEEDEVGEIVFSSDEDDDGMDGNGNMGINQGDSDSDEGFGSDEEFFNPGMQTKTKKGDKKKKKKSGGGGGGGRKKQRR